MRLYMPGGNEDLVNRASANSTNTSEASAENNNCYNHHHAI